MLPVSSSTGLVLVVKYVTFKSNSILNYTLNILKKLGQDFLIEMWKYEGNIRATRRKCAR